MKIEQGNIIVGIAVGIAITFTLIYIIKQIQKGRLVELRRDNQGNIVEIFERGL